MKLTSTLATALLWALALPTAFAHDGDLKLLHKKPMLPGGGFQNSWLRQPARPDGMGPNADLALGGFGSQRVTLLSWVTLQDFNQPPEGNGNSLWGYTSPGGRRYALMGLYTGTGIVDITDPTSPVIVDLIAGPQSLWRDVRTYGHYAYAVSEGGGGIQVLDLVAIDSGIVSLVNTVNDDATSATHTVCVDTQSGFLYRAGGGTNGLRVYSLANPALPSRVATWSDMYVHEVSVFTYTSGPNAGRQIAFACSGFNGGFQQTGLRILDVTNKANIQQLDQELYPGAQYCHQAWLDDQGQYLYIDDEFWSGPCTTIVLDVSNLNNISFVGTFSDGNNSIAHNLYVVGDKLYSANYKSGLRVWDLSTSRTSPTKWAWFDTAPEDDARTFNSLWNTYAYFGNGVVIGSDLEKGLFVWYVGDPELTIGIPGGAPQEIDPAGKTVAVHVMEAVPGAYQPGTAMLHYDTGSGFVSTPLTDLGGGLFQADFPALSCGTQFTWYVSAESTDGIVWTEPASAPLVLHQSIAGLSSSVLSDDFQTNTGWTTANLGASSGLWQRGVPINDPTWDYDPESDADGSGSCWVTDNGPGNTDVDGGSVQLISPALDLSGGGSASVAYDYFLRLTVIESSDRLLVEASDNGTAGPWVVIATHATDGGLSWRHHSVSGDELTTAGLSLTSDVRLRFTASDGGTASIVEAGLDAVHVDRVECSTGVPFCSGDGSTTPCPCGNAGMPGHGCDNSAATGGAVLMATGDPAANSVVLHGEGFPTGSSPTVLVIRSTTQSAVPATFGDGLRCIDAPVVRMAASSAIGGVSNHPLNHQAGPGTFHYQLWYRNSASFCTPEPFNLSNGYSIVFP